MNLLCPNCQKMLQVPEQYAGQLMKCPLCSGTFTVPADADLGQIKPLLTRGQADGWWHIEESCLTDAWRTA